MEVMEIVNYLLGGCGMVSTVVGVMTVKATRKKADAEAESAVADTEQKNMSLARDYVDEFNENIRDPLMREVRGLRREIKSLRNAINKIKDCPHANDCPVNSELRKQQDREGEQERGNQSKV
ncbi:MAG: hypothetical protein MJZ27_09975 [Bacteroidales bacterium]|nr:hypothetical protein [Candidatus Scybalousia scybalohippi]MCQ2202401.1 hypothetical protein [Bacteroidales bacterium]MCQ2327009.1 hypothetical protein [Bacteroidales bacterium]